MSGFFLRFIAQLFYTIYCSVFVQSYGNFLLCIFAKKSLLKLGNFEKILAIFLVIDYDMDK